MQLRTMLTLTPADFDGGRGDWALALAEGYMLVGDSARARAFGDTAAAGYADVLRRWDVPGERWGGSQPVAIHALALAYAGRAAEAAAEAERAIDLGPKFDYGLYLAARAYLLIGNVDRALELLRRILRMQEPGNVTAGWLRIDRHLDPLRQEPRFARLVGAS